MDAKEKVPCSYQSYFVRAAKMERSSHNEKTKEHFLKGEAFSIGYTGLVEDVVSNEEVQKEEGTCH